MSKQLIDRGIQSDFAYVVCKDWETTRDFGIHLQRSPKLGYFSNGGAKYYTIRFNRNNGTFDIYPTNNVNIGMHLFIKKQHLNELALLPDEAIHVYLETFIRK